MRVTRRRNAATGGSAAERSRATRRSCWRISPPKLWATKEISPCARRGSARSSGKTLLARSTKDMAWPRQRLGAESCWMLQTARPGMSSVSHRGHNVGLLPEENHGVLRLEKRMP